MPARCKRPGGGRDRLLQHDHRIAGGDGEIVDARQRRQAMRLQRRLADDQHAGGAVADLRGVGGADPAALLKQLDRGDALRRSRRRECPRRCCASRSRRRSSVTGTRTISAANAPLPIARAALTVALQREFVELVARETIFGGDHLGADELAEHRDAEPLLDALRERPGADAVLHRQASPAGPSAPGSSIRRRRR